MGVQPGRTAELKAAIGELQKQASYADPRHPDHAATVRDMTRLYGELYPGAPSESGAGVGGELPRLYSLPVRPVQAGDPSCALRYGSLKRIRLIGMLVMPSTAASWPA